MHSYINKKVLITTNDWFYGKDGRQYKSIHGTLKGIHEVSKIFGFTPNRNHANWVIEIGDVTIMGCQVLYCEACEDVHAGPVKELVADDKSELGMKEVMRSSGIYIVK